jgi:hypothetical protein
LLANSLVCCLFIYCRWTALSFGQAALDTGAGGAGVGVATRSGASRCSYLQLG